MPRPRTVETRPVRRLLPLKVLFPLLLGVALSLAIVVFSELGFRRLEAANRSMALSLETQSTLHEIRALIVQAETGQRGYLLTGQAEYLAPYRTALPKIEERFNRLRTLASQYGSPEQIERTVRFNTLIGMKLAELEAKVATEVDEVAADWDLSTEELETVLVKPKRGGVSVQLVALVWVPAPVVSDAPSGRSPGREESKG